MKPTYYVCEYTQYPIYEPAEGGYYYEGTQLTSYVKTHSLKRARKLLKKWVTEFYECEGILTPDAVEGISTLGNHHWYGTRYVGEGMEWHIETKLRSHEHGWRPYC